MNTSVFNDKFFNIDGDILELQLIDTYEGEDGALPFYWWDIILKSSDVVIGKISFRIGHNYHSYYNGNIGYEIDEEYRGNHYALTACRMVLKLAEYYNMDKLYLTCDYDNVASYKTIEKLLEVVIQMLIWSCMDRSSVISISLLQLFSSSFVYFAMPDSLPFFLLPLYTIPAKKANVGKFRIRHFDERKNTKIPQKIFDFLEDSDSHTQLFLYSIVYEETQGKCRGLLWIIHHLSGGDPFYSFFIFYVLHKTKEVLWEKFP